MNKADSEAELTEPIRKRSPRPCGTEFSADYLLVITAGCEAASFVWACNPRPDHEAGRGKRPDPFLLPEDHRPQATITPPDAFKSAFAMFSLKDSSLLAFDERRHEGNLLRLYGINRVPSDTRMREILDPVNPEVLRPVFNDVFRELDKEMRPDPVLLPYDKFENLSKQSSDKSNRTLKRPRLSFADLSCGLKSTPRL